MVITSCKSLSASARGRWKALRPMIEPNEPPLASSLTSASTSSAVPLTSPPEKMTMRLPLNALCTTCRTRSASVETGMFAFSKAFFASGCSMWSDGGLTLMTCAPSCAVICAA